MYRIIAAPLALIIRVYFQHVEVVGLHRVPSDGPVIFVANHPNGLVDPVLMLCYAPRQITFLGKATLFKMFFIGWVARMIEAVPVYRLQDEEGGIKAGTAQKNQITFEKVRALLSQGKSIFICPEGVSHSDSKLKPLKSGAARIALGSGLENLKIVPVGLYYTEKHEFRSSALINFGEPFGMPPIAQLGTPSEPDRLAVRALTERMKDALEEVTIQAEHVEALQLIEKAERIFSAARTTTSSSQRETLPWASQKIRRNFLLRRQFMARYQELKAISPEKTAALEERIRRFEEKLLKFGLKPEDLLPPDAAIPARIIGGTVLAALRLVALPLVLLGVITHFAIYRLIGFLSIKLAKQEDDLISTMKVLSAMAFFPALWLVLAGFVWYANGIWSALFSLVLFPLSGYAALLFIELFQADIGRARAIWLLVTRVAVYQELRNEQISVRDDILALGR